MSTFTSKRLIEVTTEYNEVEVFHAYDKVIVHRPREDRNPRFAMHNNAFLKKLQVISFDPENMFTFKHATTDLAVYCSIYKVDRFNFSVENNDLSLTALVGKDICGMWTFEACGYIEVSNENGVMSIGLNC